MEKRDSEKSLEKSSEKDQSLEEKDNGKVPEVKIKTSQEVANLKLHCSSPDRELVVYPRWFCFYSDQQFKTPQFITFFVENREKYKVTYTIKAREKIFRIDSSCGILEPKQRRVLRLFLLAADDWPLAVHEYTQRRLKLAVESLRVPAELEPVNAAEEKKIARSIWKRSFNEWPLERLYNKINMTLIPHLHVPSPPRTPPPAAARPPSIHIPGVDPVSLRNLI